MAQELVGFSAVVVIVALSTTALLTHSSSPRSAEPRVELARNDLSPRAPAGPDASFSTALAADGLHGDCGARPAAPGGQPPADLC